MGNQLANIKRLEADLWETADNLRANSKLTSTEYCMPVLGIIFLRHAANRFDTATEEIKASGLKRSPVKADYVKRRALFLPEESRYEYLLDLPSDTDLGEAVNTAMDKIEESFEPLAGVLPREYGIFEREVLEDLLRAFDSEAMKSATGDVFGRIYEYFLMKFAMQGAQDNGEFFTPPSLVQTIVNIIEPTRGVVLDPAVGSAGMFVQSSHFVEAMGQDAAHNLTFYGQEKTATTIRLAKMNLAVHGLEGDIVEANSFYEDEHGLLGKADYVMANPPFNVDMVDAEKVKGDVRLPFGLPSVNKKKKVSNGNYLWIQYFYSYLSDKGRSGFVMASSASDAGGDDKLIRQQLVETGHVDVMVTIGTNFFYTRPLPCMLWFFDKGKPKERIDKVLMIDARTIYRKVTRVINDFSPEQLQNIASIVWLHRGETERYLSLVRGYLLQASKAACELAPLLDDYSETMGEFCGHLETWNCSLSADPGEEIDNINSEAFSTAFTDLVESWSKFKDAHSQTKQEIAELVNWIGSAGLETNRQLIRAHERTEAVMAEVKSIRKIVNQTNKLASTCYDIATKKLDANKAEGWNTAQTRELHKTLIRTPKDGEAANLRVMLLDAFRLPGYFQRQVNWLQCKFPDATYVDVEGICKSVQRGEVADNEYSLSPGRYVGVAAIEDDAGFDFDERMAEIRGELAELNTQAIELSQEIDFSLLEVTK
ncbi:type I restriction-modification system, M subunit [Rhodopirellula maiorica SM1]|uniref:site-specific DNA-methyltransferase (adenine-specific) n=1 Tax=Rhodopirellula maiorica SM1 TaxID=1265738 RepID=M5RLS1_9BACT|nr:type I restriction-modification system subunit M [Rhodopirellula maiorica]EMI20156.1 type I restriction-modification system, M subunit [Rhodopirellula maiorica SM1]